ncbi:MAG: heme A synthase [Gemmatimonadetes bacterium]|nr:heme A synthase [Gemmatimonadota bacterium]
MTVVWTLGLLFLGSVVHATESSLACPDWPTCFGTMVPEMTGGVFWEHLHRLVAGGLVLMFGLATWLARQEAPDRPWIFKACLAGLGLLVIQSIFGGLTVIYRLPDLVSTTHLTLAFAFLTLASVLAAATSRGGGPVEGLHESMGMRLRALAGFAWLLVFLQSVVGGLVRHTDAGMACPDVPLCLGQVVPPLVNLPITAHFAHRVVALVATGAVLWLAVAAHRRGVPGRIRRWVVAAVALVLVQVALGVASVLTVLAVVPVSLHTLVAAALLAVLAATATLATRPEATSGAPATSNASDAVLA